jgi:acyl carrier protein
MGLDTVELVMAAERQFQIEVPNAEAERWRTVGDMHAGINALLAERFVREGRALTVDPDITWALLRDLVVAELGVKPEQVRPDAEFVRDLGAD